MSQACASFILRPLLPGEPPPTCFIHAFRSSSRGLAAGGAGCGRRMLPCSTVSCRAPCGCRAPHCTRTDERRWEGPCQSPWV